jgi:hypothetical protein
MSKGLDPQWVALRRKRALWVARAIAVARRREMRRRMSAVHARLYAKAKEHDDANH